MMKFFNLIIYVYLFFFGRHLFVKFNVIIFKIIIKSLGYNNYGSYNYTGEKNFIKILKRYKIKLCLDIGANVGDYSEMLLKLTNAKVIALEPNKFSFKILKKIELKNKKRFTCFNVAASDKKKKGFLYYGSNTSEIASIMQNTNKLNFVAGTNSNKMKIQLSTLDEIFLKNKSKFKDLDFIKIDTEGHEIEVLKGLKKIIKVLTPKFLQIEFNTHQLLRSITLQDYRKFLKNYDVFRLLPFGKKLAPVNINKPEDNIFHLSNIVFIRKDLNFKNE